MYTARFRKIVLPIYQCPTPGSENLSEAFNKYVLGIGVDEELDDVIWKGDDRKGVAGLKRI